MIVSSSIIITWGNYYYYLLWCCCRRSLQLSSLIDRYHPAHCRIISPFSATVALYKFDYYYYYYYYYHYYYYYNKIVEWFPRQSPFSPWQLFMLASFETKTQAVKLSESDVRCSIAIATSINTPPPPPPPPPPLPSPPSLKVRPQ